ncbi:uncharacterized protein LOC109846850 [Asparagus officinalis]|uniref:uncharacterized protein LOC109846850 n=1 Tax=Asparagus officinalis TaxID=4686 RepID=UPI00098E1901|nr:uncharacterized protein LOC109846850 [Asparagus officinalis]
MIGAGSLGLRSTGSYGSLQHQSQQDYPVRKNSKERRLWSICRIAIRKKATMLLLLSLISVAAILFSFFLISRDVNQPADPETVFGYSDHVWNLVDHDRISSNYIRPPPAPATEDKETVVIQHDIFVNETQPFSLFRPVPIPLHHPCENFSLPPSQVNPKRPGPRPCDVCYVPVDLAVAYMPTLPSISPVIKNLHYVSEENLLADESNGGSIFGGHPSLKQREASFDIKETMTVYCGFAKGKKPGQGTGFNIDEADILEMEQCRGVVVASAIFGNYDVMQQPRNIREISRRTACFYMFVDEVTEASIKNSSALVSTRKVGLWRVVVVRDLPYADARRTGKVPKLLLHRLFPNARFSVWIDGKLELVVDPYQLLERFLWRNNATLAISKHYKRFDVFEEAEANKAAGKYENASIDYQIEFYKREGLTHFYPDKYPITSDVPEGCVIIREHIPITNLFTCLWFNEVDRFTSRDQLSFSTTRDKIRLKTNWLPFMFMDCERRNFVIQAYHRDLLEKKRASQNHLTQPSWVKELRTRSESNEVHNVATSRSTPSRKQPSRRGKGKKSGSKRHRLRGAGSVRDSNSF